MKKYDFFINGPTDLARVLKEKNLCQFEDLDFYLNTNRKVSDEELTNMIAKHECQLLKRPNILIIDDDPDFNRVLSSYLNSSIEYNGRSFEDEIDALHLLGKDDIDVFFIDVNLNHFNGFELGKIIRHFLNFPVPIVYMSQDKNVFLKTNQIDHNENVLYLNKPLTKEDFYGSINKILHPFKAAA